MINIYNFKPLRKKLIDIFGLPKESIIVSLGLNFITYTINGKEFVCRSYQRQFNFWGYLRLLYLTLIALSTKGWGMALFVLTTDTTSTNNKDTQLRSDKATTNFGSQDYFYSGYASGSYTIRGIISFTTPNISGTISACRLYMSSLADASTTQRVHQLSANTDWVENQATWNIAKTGANWNTSGGDFNSTIIDEVTAPAYNATLANRIFYFQLQGTGSDNPLTMAFNTAYHFLIKNPESSTQLGRIYTKEATLSEDRPYLEITYTDVSTAYTLTVDAATVNVVDQDIGLLSGKKLNVDVDTATVSGQAIGLLSGKNISVNNATLNVVGQEIGLLTGNYAISVDVATVNVAGQDIDFKYNRIFSINKADVSVAGQDTGLLFKRLLVVDYAPISVSGQDITISKGYPLSVDYASVSVAGQDINFLNGKGVLVEAATINVIPKTIKIIYWKDTDRNTANWSSNNKSSSIWTNLD